MRQIGGPLTLTVALVAGILLGERAGPGAAVVALGAATLLGIVATCAQGHARLLVAVVALALLGTAVMQRALDGLVHSPLAAPISGRVDATVRGVLVDDPDGSRFFARVLVRVDRVRLDDGQWSEAGGRTLLVRATGDAAPRVAVLEAGDRVALRGWLRPLDGFDRRERWRHAVGTLEASELVAFRAPGSAPYVVANAARAAVLRGTLSLAPTERGVASGFLVGDTREIPATVVDQFRSSGLSHLLVVSGENVAFVLALAGPLLRRLPRRARLVAAIALLLLFGTMTRWEPSVLRACAMAGCSLLAVFLGRPVAGRRALAIAVGVLLVADPFLVHSVGFLLSCAACLGIATFGPVLATRLRGPAWVRETLATTLAAQLGVAPVLIPVFGSVPLVSLPANLLAMPLAGPLTVWGMAAGLAGGLVRGLSPALAGLLQVPTAFLVRGVLVVAALASRVPLEVDARGACGLAALGALVACLARYRSGWPRGSGGRRAGTGGSGGEVVPAR